jgi:hypothetical protein
MKRKYLNEFVEKREKFIVKNKDIILSYLEEEEE